MKYWNFGRYLYCLQDIPFGAEIQYVLTESGLKVRQPFLTYF